MGRHYPSIVISYSQESKCSAFFKKIIGNKIIKKNQCKKLPKIA